MRSEGLIFLLQVMMGPSFLGFASPLPVHRESVEVEVEVEVSGISAAAKGTRRP